MPTYCPAPAALDDLAERVMREKSPELLDTTAAEPAKRPRRKAK